LFVHVVDVRALFVELALDDNPTGQARAHRYKNWRKTFDCLEEFPRGGRSRSRSPGERRIARSKCCRNDTGLSLWPYAGSIRSVAELTSE
jgi:hypothetical protein